MTEWLYHSRRKKEGTRYWSYKGCTAILILHFKFRFLKTVIKLHFMILRCHLQELQCEWHSGWVTDSLTPFTFNVWNASNFWAFLKNNVGLFSAIVRVSDSPTLLNYLKYIFPHWILNFVIKYLIPLILYYFLFSSVHP